MYRKRIKGKFNKRRDKRRFSKSASRTHRRNYSTGSMRGGIRL